MTNIKTLIVCVCLAFSGSLYAQEYVNFDLGFAAITTEVPVVFDLGFNAVAQKGCGCGCPECICTSERCEGENCPCQCGTCPCHGKRAVVTPVSLEPVRIPVTNLNVGEAPMPAYTVKICVNKAPKVTEPIVMDYSPVRQVYTVSPNYRNRWTWPGMTENSLRSHLIRTHGLASSIVYASTFAELKALHDEAHGTRVVRNYVGYKTKPTATNSASPKTVALQSYVNSRTSSSCPGGVCPGTTSYGSYSSSSCPGGNCPTYTYQRQTYSSGSNCPSGNCPGSARPARRGIFGWR